LTRKIKPLEIRADGASVKVSDKLRLKEIQMKAKADGIAVDQFCQALAHETQEFYRRKLYPTKFGPEKAWEEDGSWRMEDANHGSQAYTLQNILEANLYRHIRAYLMGLILSEKDRRTKKYAPGAVILRNDDTVAIVKRGKLKLQSADDYFGTLDRSKSKRTKNRK
jgi:hypothetical protein